MSWNMPIIDIHTHGIGGYDTKGATPEDILRIAEIHGSHGVDAIIPTIYSGSIERDEGRHRGREESDGNAGCRRRRFKVQGSRFEVNRQ